MRLSLAVAACAFLGVLAPAQEKQVKQKPLWVVNKDKHGTTYTQGPCYVFVPSDQKFITIIAVDSGFTRGQLHQNVIVRWDETGSHPSESRSVLRGRMWTFQDPDTTPDVFLIRCRSAANELPAEVRKLFGDQWGIH